MDSSNCNVEIHENKDYIIFYYFSKKVHAQMNSDVVLSKMEHHIQPLRDTGLIIAT